MKIILNKDVQNLGEEGDVRDVAPGYARNYLIPKGMAVSYTKQSLALLEGKRKVIEKRKQEKKEQAAGLKDRIEALDLHISMTAGETGRLFGSVTNAMLAEELAKIGIEVERKKIEIPEHTIKSTGNFVVKVKLYGSEVASLKVTVAGPEGPTEKKAKVPTAAEQDQAAPEAQPTAETQETPQAETVSEADDAVEEPVVTEPPTEVVEMSEAAETSETEEPVVTEPPTEAVETDETVAENEKETEADDEEQKEEE